MPLVNKTFSDIITFSRASSATMFDSSGTLVYAPMNLLTYSEEFDNADWTKQSSVSVSTDTTIAPNGTTTADTITADSGSGIFQNITVTIGQRVTQSIYLRAGTATSVMFRDDTGAGRHIVVNPSTGVVTSTAGTLIDFGSILMGNGWYRIYFSYVADATLVRGNVRPDSAGAGQTFILWGAQTNFYPMQGGVTGDLSTYYPTTSAAYQGPRFDYNPATLAARGFLIEEQRTNLLLQSADFTTTWIQTNVTITANTTASPDGGTNGDTLLTNVAGATTSQNSQSFTAGSTITVTVFAKKNASNFVRFEVGGLVNCWFDLNTGVTGTNGAGSGNVLFSAKSIQSISNGWYRCVLTVTTTTITTLGVNIFATNADNTSSAINSSIFLWGAQLEAGAFPTSYIPTTTTALTRSADVASVNTLSPWFNATEGTLYAQGILVGGVAGTFPGQVALVGSNANTDNIRISWSANSGAMRFGVRVADVNQVDLAGPSKLSGDSYKVAGTYKTNDAQAAFDGTASTVDTSVTLPVITSLLFGGTTTYQLPGNLWLRRTTYYPRRLSQAELVSLTA